MPVLGGPAGHDGPGRPIPCGSDPHRNGLTAPCLPDPGKAGTASEAPATDAGVDTLATRVVDTLLHGVGRADTP
ncbi:hypothetical protein SATRM34S_05339 [Streptomyces atroolivaceus]